MQRGDIALAEPEFLENSIGMLAERHIIEGTVEHLVSQMTPAERLERVEQLRQKAEAVYLPQYERMQKTLDVTPDRVSVGGVGGGDGVNGNDDDGVGVGDGGDAGVGDGDSVGADKQ